MLDVKRWAAKLLLVGFGFVLALLLAEVVLRVSGYSYPYFYASDAYTCFMRTEMDCLVLGNTLLMKSEQGRNTFAEDLSWQEEFQLD